MLEGKKGILGLVWCAFLDGGVSIANSSPLRRVGAWARVTAIYAGSMPHREKLPEGQFGWGIWHAGVIAPQRFVTSRWWGPALARSAGDQGAGLSAAYGPNAGEIGQRQKSFRQAHPQNSRQKQAAMLSSAKEKRRIVIITSTSFGLWSHRSNGKTFRRLRLRGFAPRGGRPRGDPRTGEKISRTHAQGRDPSGWEMAEPGMMHRGGRRLAEGRGRGTDWAYLPLPADGAVEFPPARYSARWSSGIPGPRCPRTSICKRVTAPPATHDTGLPGGVVCNLRVAGSLRRMKSV